MRVGVLITVLRADAELVGAPLVAVLLVEAELVVAAVLLVAAEPPTVAVLLVVALAEVSDFGSHSLTGVSAPPSRASVTARSTPTAKTFRAGMAFSALAPGMVTSMARPIEPPFPVSRTPT